ncbi:MAG: hypothetical protein LKI93_04965 [Bifidobacteriaceae bacterium]|jgi:hypothetical protein|nr:hypothetical protein [Bifidobacteriaceae bacterium]MCI1914709.1 hypothetical protein [Bifidobacteriaceae bacterium]
MGGISVTLRSRAHARRRRIVGYVVIAAASLAVVITGLFLGFAHAADSTDVLQEPHHSVSVEKSATAGKDRYTVTLAADGNSATQTTPLDVAVVLDTGYAMPSLSTRVRPPPRSPPPKRP